MATIPGTLDDARRDADSRQWVGVWARNEALSLLAFLAIVVAFFLIVEPSMRQSKVYFDLLREVSPTLIAGVGITMLLLSGEFDLTIGSMLAFTGVATVVGFNETGSMWLGLAIGLATGPLIGLINGLLVTVVGMQSLMTTLGMMFTIRGFVYVYTNQKAIVNETDIRSYTSLWSGDIGPVPVPAVISAILVAVGYFTLTRTQFGRNVYAIGGNPQAARVSGIDVQRVKLLLFVISSTLAAVAGLLLTAQTNIGYFDAGSQGFELTVLASVVLGGVSLAGGQGNLLSAMLAVVILGVIGKGMRLMEVHTTQQLLVIGIVMLIAVYYHRVRKRVAANLRAGSAGSA